MGDVGRLTGYRRTFLYMPSGAPPQRRTAAWLVQRATKLALWAYMRLVHDYTFRYDPGLPTRQPYVEIMSHTSLLDVPALMVADPYDPPTSMVIKRDMTDVPLLGTLLRGWGAIPVARDGRDVAALRRIRQVLKEGRGICVAPSGTRSADGRTGPFNPVLVRLILQSDAAVFPVVIVGSRDCLPKGARMIRPGKIRLDTGPVLDLSRFRQSPSDPAVLAEAALYMRDAIDRLLPPEMHALPGTPPLLVA